MTLPVVVLFATGGTISSLADDTAAGYVAALGGRDFLKRIHGHQRLAEVEVIDFSCIASQDMTTRMVVDLSHRVNAALERKAVAGVIITHGTGSLEDTCFLVDLLLRVDKPVVGTGAMYSASEPEWDGRRNILDSLAAATDSQSRGKGVMICMNGELHAARDVCKMHTSSPAAFISPGTGPLGCVDEGQVIYYRSPIRRWTLPVEDVEDHVEVIKVVQGCDDKLFRAALRLGARGLVLEGMGGRGAVPSWFLPAIAEAHGKGVPVVLCSRSPMGRVALTVSASRVALKNAGVISAGDLPAHKARVLLMVALAYTQNADEIREIFATVAP